MIFVSLFGCVKYHLFLTLLGTDLKSVPSIFNCRQIIANSYFSLTLRRVPCALCLSNIYKCKLFKSMWRLIFQEVMLLSILIFFTGMAKLFENIEKK